MKVGVKIVLIAILSAVSIAAWYSNQSAQRLAELRYRSDSILELSEFVRNFEMEERARSKMKCLIAIHASVAKLKYESRDSSRFLPSDLEDIEYLYRPIPAVMSEIFGKSDLSQRDVDSICFRRL